jgi:hypothetical protein
MRSSQLLILALLVSAVAHADITTFTDVHLGGGDIIYAGGDAPLEVDYNPPLPDGSEGIGFFAAQTDISCNCEVTLQSGPFTGADISDWNFASGGVITVTGSLVINPSAPEQVVLVPTTTILTGILGPIDLMTSYGGNGTWGLMFDAPFLAVVNPEVLEVLGQPENSLYQGDFYEETGGPGPPTPGPVSALFFGPDAATLSFQPVPEPASVLLLGAVAAIWVIRRDSRSRFAPAVQNKVL